MARRILPWRIAPAPAPPEIGEPAVPRQVPVDASHPTVPFENLAFEGGGVKSFAYLGALEILEEIGLYPDHIRRVAGASSGGFMATFAALGTSAADLRDLMETHDLGEVLQDARFGVVSGVVNLVRRFGMHPGNRLLSFLGEQFEARAGAADITFRQLLEHHGRELCIPVTNLHRMCTEYCHPKTTPDLPVRVAVGMTMSLPGLMVPYQVWYRPDWAPALYNDGGLLCNYPVHAFDGWWLSRLPEDTFFRRLRPLTERALRLDDRIRFHPRNPRTLGFTVAQEGEVDPSQAWRLPSARPPARPDTALARARGEQEAQTAARVIEVTELTHAAERLLDALAKVDTDGDGAITWAEAAPLFEEGGIPDADATRLFGERSPREMFDHLDNDDNGRVSYAEVVALIDAHHAGQTAHFGGPPPLDPSMSGYFSQMFRTVWAHVSRMNLHPDDVDRTVPIFTDYVTTADFGLEPDDYAFLVESGRRATAAFLRQHAPDAFSEGTSPVRRGPRAS